MAAVDLTTLAALKAWMSAGGNVMGSTEDVVLNRLITAASIQIINYVNRPFLLSQSVTEIFDGKGGVQYTPRNYPVTAITSLTIDGVVIPASTDGVSVAGYWLYQDIVTLVGTTFGRFASGQFQFNRGKGNCKLVYVAGYGAGSNDMLTLEQACIDLCVLKYRGRKNVGLRSENIGPSGGTVYDKKGIPDEIAVQLSNYVNHIPR